MYGNPAPHFNTRPKLLEVSHEKTSQHNKGLLTISSPVVSLSALNGAPYKLRTRPPRWLPELRYMWNIGQTADALWTNHLALRRRQTKTKTDEAEDGGRLTLRTSELAAPSQLTTPQSEHTT